MLRTYLTVLCCLALAAPAVAGVVINEVDYDQPSTDSAEWIELHNPDGAPMSLAGYELVLYNGTLTGDCSEYCRIDLDPWTIPPGGYIVLGQHACAVAPLCVTTNAIQNGAPDAIAIEERATGAVVHSVEYESDLVNSVCGLEMTDATDNPADATGTIAYCPPFWYYDPVGSPCQSNPCAVPAEDMSWGALKDAYR